MLAQDAVCRLPVCYFSYRAMTLSAPPQHVLNLMKVGLHEMCALHLHGVAEFDVQDFAFDHLIYIISLPVKIELISFSTLHPKPESLHPKPSTLSPKPKP